MKRNTAMKLVNSRTPEQWAETIRAKWQDNVGSIFEVALMLETAKEELQSGFGKMVRDNLKWSPPMVSMMLTIAGDHKLADVQHAELPASWMTLYALAKLTDEQFENGMKSGVIHPGMQRKDIAQLKPPKEKRSPAPGTKIRKSALPRDEVVEEEVYSLVVSVIHEMDEEHCIDFFERMRGMLDQLERTAKANRSPVGAVQ